METTNYYEDRANRQLLNGKSKKENTKPSDTETKSENWKNTAKGVGTDVLVGVLGGGLAAAAIGKPAFLVGLVISGYGHFSQNKVVSALGLGMMASGTMSALSVKSQNPELPERLKAFQEELKRKLYLDKLSPAKKKETVNGIEENTSQISTSSKPLSEEDFSALKDLGELDKKQKVLEDQEENQVSNEMEEWFKTERIY